MEPDEKKNLTDSSAAHPELGGAIAPRPAIGPAEVVWANTATRWRGRRRHSRTAAPRDVLNIEPPRDGTPRSANR